MAPVACHRPAVSLFDELPHFASGERRGQRTLHIAPLPVGYQPLGIGGHVVDGPLEGRPLEGDDILHRDFFLRNSRKGIDGKRLHHLKIRFHSFEGVGGVELPIGPLPQVRHESGVEEPKSAGGVLLGQGGVSFLPDEGLPRSRIVPAPVDRLLPVVVRHHKPLPVGGVDLLDDAPVGDHRCLLVRDPLCRPDGPGLATLRCPAVAHSEDLKHP